MTRLRIILLVVLFVAPYLVLMALGGYHLWTTGYSWVWWPLLACMGVAYYVAWRWTRRKGVLPEPHEQQPGYWTDRDRTAWEQVDAKAKSFEKLTLEDLSTAKHFSDIALELAKDVGRVYNPDSDDPFDALTLPEVLTCVELAAADLNSLVQKYIPAVHLLRIRDVRTAKKAYGWYQTGSNVYWAGAALFNPSAILTTGLRYLATRKALGGLMDRIQSNVILWFHTAYIHELGKYLIELNSGRLKVGVAKYREILSAHQEPPAGEPSPGPAPGPDAMVLELPPPPPAPAPITIAVLGPVKAGKSSLVNALLEKQTAAVDRLPVASGTRYDLTLPGGQPVSLFDTSGYGEEGAKDADFAAAVEASRQADLILLVTPALVPGRQADVDLIERLKTWFAAHPHLRMPPVTVVVNQVDLLSPKAEWKPPYHWKDGTRPKELNIRECLAVVREQVGDRAAEIIPTCARHGETFGIVDDLVPAIGGHLDHARGSAILKAFEAAGSERKIAQVIDQVGNVAHLAWGAVSGLLSKKK
jgi:predicted GTPase